jgi:hypothetical protein
LLNFRITNSPPSRRHQRIFRLGCDALYMPSYAGEGTAKASWPWLNVGTESCWQWCRGVNVDRSVMSRRVVLTMVLSSRCWPWREVATMVLPSQCWLWREVIVESCRRWCRRVDVGRGTRSLSNHTGDGTYTCKTNKLMQWVTMHVAIFLSLHVFIINKVGIACINIQYFPWFRLNVSAWRRGGQLFWY